MTTATVAALALATVQAQPLNTTATATTASTTDSVSYEISTTATEDYIIRDVKFEGNYSEVVWDHIKFLRECSEELAPIVCIDVKPSTIVGNTMSRDDIQDLDEDDGDGKSSSGLRRVLG